MKIIAVGMNYALHNKELGHTHENKEPVIFLKPDSAILKDGKPFFIPDFSNELPNFRAFSSNRSVIGITVTPVSHLCCFFRIHIRSKMPSG